MAQRGDRFDPYRILGALERNYVEYVVIGGLARVLRGTFETTRGVDVCPSVAEGNIERLGQVVEELNGGAEADLNAETLVSEDVISLRTRSGEFNVVAAPAGVPGGFADLRRAATREDLGHWVRPLVASTADLARMAAALRREQDVERLSELRRIVELEAERGPVPLMPEIRGPGRIAQRRSERERGMER
jgi:hypothetical protein